MIFAKFLFHASSNPLFFPVASFPMDYVTRCLKKGEELTLAKSGQALLFVYKGVRRTWKRNIPSNRGPTDADDFLVLLLLLLLTCLVFSFNQNSWLTFVEWITVPQCIVRQLDTRGAVEDWTTIQRTTGMITRRGITGTKTWWWPALSAFRMKAISIQWLPSQSKCQFGRNYQPDSRPMKIR